MIFLKRRALMTRASFNYKTVSGIGSVVLENCVETRFKRLSLSGNSVQTTTKGLQLLDKTKIPTPQAGVAYYNMQVEEGKYTLSTKYRRAVQKDLFLFAGEVDTGASSDINGVDSTISRTVESINGYITIGYRKGENGVNPFDFETMLNKGDTPLPCEPYTGGKPSPSPEYPQEVISAGKYDEASGKYVIDVGVTGKNLVPPELDFVPFGNNDPKTIEFDPKTNSYKLITKPDNFNQVTCYVKFNLKKGIYTITRKIKIDGVDITNPAGLQIIDADTKENLFYQHTGINRKFELKKDTNVLINLGHFTEKTQKEAILCEVQLEKSDVSTPYEPYHEPQTLQLQLEKPLTKWDKIEKRDGVYGIVYKHRTVDDLATLVKDSEPIYGNPGERYFSVPVKDATLNYDYSKAYSECGLYKKEVQRLYVPRLMLSSFIIYVNDTDTIETAKEHLHYKVIYETDSEEFVPFPQETQLVLENLHANDGTTIITVDSGEVETGIEVEYAVKE